MRRRGLQCWASYLCPAMADAVFCCTLYARLDRLRNLRRVPGAVIKCAFEQPSQVSRICSVCAQPLPLACWASFGCRLSVSGRSSRGDAGLNGLHTEGVVACRSKGIVGCDFPESATTTLGRGARASVKSPLVLAWLGLSGFGATQKLLVESYDAVAASHHGQSKLPPPRTRWRCAAFTLVGPLSCTRLRYSLLHLAVTPTRVW